MAGAAKEAATVPVAAFANDAETGHAQFSGVVIDAVGVPLPEVAVAMCASACWPTTTDNSGRFWYPSLPVERYVLDIRGESVGGRTLTSVVLPVDLTDGGGELPPVQLHDATALDWQGTATGAVRRPEPGPRRAGRSGRPATSPPAPAAPRRPQPSAAPGSRARRGRNTSLPRRMCATGPWRCGRCTRSGHGPGGR